MQYHSEEFFLYKRTRGTQKGIYYYCYKDDEGKRNYRSTGEKTRAAAMEVILQRIGDGTLTKKKKSDMPFKEFSKPFWIWETCPIVQSKIKRGGKLTQQYCRDNRRIMELHVSPFFDKKIVSKITPKMVEDWLINLPEKHKIGAKTANDAYMVLDQILDVAVLQRIIPQNPCNEVKKLIKKTKPRGCYTVDQVSRLFAKEWEDDKFAYAACLLSATTGMRMGEIKALTPRQINDDYINVNAAWGGNLDKRKSTKSGKDRVVPILPEVRSILLELSNGRGPDDYLFSLSGDIPLNDKYINNRMQAKMTELGIDYKKENLSFHSFRHFFNTRLVASGIESEIVRACVGHESIEMTENYLHLKADDMKAIQEVQKRIFKSAS